MHYALNAITDTENRITIHVFNIRNLTKKMQKQVDFLIQEHRSIVFKRYARCINENLKNIKFDKNKVYAHWIVLCRKAI